MGFMQAVALYYELTDRVPPFQAQRFARSLAAAVPRSEHSLRTWEREAGADAKGRSLLDVGCGTAPLLQVAAGRYTRVAGVDVAFRWLVMARKRLEDAGVEAPLVCACAEALPFPDGSFDRVVADSALEHMTDQPRAVRECARVLADDGWLFAATPNRFSIGPDPHTGLPAGSWLPHRLTATYVRLKGGIPPHRQLLSETSLRRLLADAGLDVSRVFLPDLADAQRAGLGRPLRAAVDAYQLAKRAPIGGALLRRIGPLLHAVAHKPAVARETAMTPRDAGPGVPSPV
jgi:ubiquinone/menaquinone biosynthesis C-methylase UbiE